jgi:hypothetical protein
MLCEASSGESELLAEGNPANPVWEFGVRAGMRLMLVRASLGTSLRTPTRTSQPEHRNASQKLGAPKLGFISSGRPGLPPPSGADQVPKLAPPGDAHAWTSPAHTGPWLLGRTAKARRMHLKARPGHPLVAAVQAPSPPGADRSCALYEARSQIKEQSTFPWGTFLQ